MLGPRLERKAAAGSPTRPPFPPHPLHLSLVQDLDKYDRTKWEEAAAQDDRTKLFFMEERAGDGDFTPVRPWQRTVVAPTRPPPERVDEPCDGLRLEWVHGHRCGDVKGGVHYTHTGEVVFFAGCVNVVLDIRTHTQVGARACLYLSRSLR